MGVHKALRRSHDPVCVVCERPVERREQGPGQMVWVHADTGSQYAPNPPEMEALMHDDQRDYAEEDAQRRHVEQENAAELLAELEAEFEAAGGRGVELADRIDRIRKQLAGERLEYLRGCLRAESISWGEILELQGLVPFIAPGDVELLEAAGVPEFPDEPRYSVQDAADYYAVTCTLGKNDNEAPDEKPAWGVIDDVEGGYIAFCTDEATAERIVAALEAHLFSEKGEL